MRTGLPRPAVILAIGATIAVAQFPGAAQAPDALRCGKGYTLTGNYVGGNGPP
jgi:hypothetical protein